MGEAVNLGMAGNAEYSTVIFTPEVFDRHWPSISKELDRVPHIWDKWFTKEYIRAASLANEFSVWAVGPPECHRLIVFTKIVVYPAERVLQACFAIGNDLERCLPSLMAALESFANLAECSRCDIVGRPGWERMLPGFHRTGVVMSRDLKPFRVQ